MRPQSGYATNVAGMSNTTQNMYKIHSQINSLANSKGFRDTNTKYDSFINNQGYSEIIAQNINVQEFDRKRNDLDFKDYIVDDVEIEDVPLKPQSLVHKITDSDTKALIDFNNSLNRVEVSRKQLIKIKNQVTSEDMATKMHKKVLSWQNYQLSFDSHSDHENDDD